MFNWFKKNCNCNNEKSESTIGYFKDVGINVWHAPILNVGDFVEYLHRPTNAKYFLFVVSITPNEICLGCGGVEVSYTITSKANGYDLMNDFIKQRNIKKLF